MKSRKAIDTLSKKGFDPQFGARPVKRVVQKEVLNALSNFELKFSNLRKYYHENILAFGDLLHTIHPLAGQGFNMTIRDINLFLDIV